MQFRKYNSFRFSPSFDDRITYQVFLHYAFHLGVWQRSQKLILHQILDIYQRISFMDQGLSIVQKLHVRRDTKSFIQKPGRKRKLNVKQSISYMHGLDKRIIWSTIWVLSPLTLLTAVNAKKSILMSHIANAVSEQFLNNWLIFIFKYNI